METTFTNIYENNSWGDNKISDYKGSSGPGSTIDFNKDNYIPFLKSFITNNNIKSVVDLGCGDFICGKSIYDDLDVVYKGYDVYDSVIKYNMGNHSSEKYSFETLDFCNNRESIASADICILKDVLQHWRLGYIYPFLDYLVRSKKFKFILICNCCTDAKHNSDILTGDWRALSCDVYPLKRYKPRKLCNYHTKEISVIVT